MKIGEHMCLGKLARLASFDPGGNYFLSREPLLTSKRKWTARRQAGGKRERQRPVPKVVVGTGEPASR